MAKYGEVWLWDRRCEDKWTFNRQNHKYVSRSPESKGHYTLLLDYFLGGQKSISSLIPYRTIRFLDRSQLSDEICICGVTTLSSSEVCHGTSTLDVRCRNCGDFYPQRSLLAGIRILYRYIITGRYLHTLSHYKVRFSSWDACTDPELSLNL